MVARYIFLRLKKSQLFRSSKNLKFKILTVILEFIFFLRIPNFLTELMRMLLILSILPLSYLMRRDIFDTLFIISGK